MRGKLNCNRCKPDIHNNGSDGFLVNPHCLALVSFRITLRKDLNQMSEIQSIKKTIEGKLLHKPRVKTSLFSVQHCSPMPSLCNFRLCTVHM